MEHYNLVVALSAALATTGAAFKTNKSLSDSGRTWTLIANLVSGAVMGAIASPDMSWFLSLAFGTTIPLGLLAGWWIGNRVDEKTLERRGFDKEARRIANGYGYGSRPNLLREGKSVPSRYR